MIEDYPAQRGSAWPLVTAEVLATLAAGALLPFGFRESRSKTARCRDQRTVVLVHGYFANRSSLWPLAAYLRWRGVEQVLSFNYASSEGVERGARALREYLRRSVRGGRVDLVCHSLGGLVARLYLQELGGARRVDRCITLGTPHAGTYNAYWLASRVGGELRPDSALLRRLRDSAGAARRVRFTSVVAGSDNMVIPRVFARHEDEAYVGELGHMGILFSPRVFRLVAERLLAAVEPEAAACAERGAA